MLRRRLVAVLVLAVLVGVLVAVLPGRVAAKPDLRTTVRTIVVPATGSEGALARDVDGILSAVERDGGRVMGVSVVNGREAGSFYCVVVHEQR